MRHTNTCPPAGAQVRTGRMLTISLAVLTLAAAGLVAAPGPPDDDSAASDRFGRMFHLPAFAEPSPQITNALLELGRRGGMLDARDDLAAGPVALIIDPALNTNNPNNEMHTAGTTFVGQFLDHDVTFDTSSRLGRPTTPRRSPNARTPFLDLDSVYGAGPAGSPHLYEASDRAKLRVESGGLHEDLPRDASGAAIIGDPRNDEHVVIAGLHAAFLLFHNAIVDRVRAEQPTWQANEVFDESRRRTTWHYQWMIVHEFLPLFVGADMVRDVFANGRRFYTPRPARAFIPVEFQMAYRFGHSMVRPSYRANFTGNDGAPFFAMVLGPAPAGADEPSDLRGGVRSPRRFVGWTTFFAVPGFEADTRPNKLIDTKLSTPLFDMPLGAIPGGAPPTSLAQRNLLRHLTWRLPSGQAIADAMGVAPLGRHDLGELRGVHRGFVESTPLFYYVLKEAEVFEGGRHLGPVGGRIVAEVFIGLLQLDPDSYLNAETTFAPVLGAVPGEFRMLDLLTVAGVAQRR